MSLSLKWLIAVCKDSYVVYACGFDRNGNRFCRDKKVIGFPHYLTLGFYLENVKALKKCLAYDRSL